MAGWQVRAMEERISTMYWSNGYLTFCDGQAYASFLFMLAFSPFAHPFSLSRSFSRSIPFSSLPSAPRSACHPTFLRNPPCSHHGAVTEPTRKQHPSVRRRCLSATRRGGCTRRCRASPSSAASSGPSPPRQSLPRHPNREGRVVMRTGREGRVDMNVSRGM